MAGYTFWIVRSFIKALKTLFKLPIYSQIASIHYQLLHGRPLVTRLKHHLFTLLTFQYILRILAVSCSLFLKWDAYFHYDIINRIIFKSTGLDDEYFAAFCVGVPLFSLYLFRKVYIHSDPAIWLPLHDLIVRNLNQVYLTLNWRDFPRLLTITIPRTGHLIEFRQISRHHRRHVIVILLLFEGVASGLKCIFQLLTLGTSVYYATIQSQWHTAILFVVDFNSFAFMIYQMIKLCVLLMTTIFVVLYIYAVQYIGLNGKLRRLLASKDLHSSTQPILSQYRRKHSQLTTYLLYFNDAFISQILLRFEAAIMPFHSYCVVLLYFTPNLSLYVILQLQFFLTVFTAIPLIVTACLWLTNKLINYSARYLVAIQMKLFGGKRYRRRSLKKKKTSEYLVRKQYQLASYYELIWRVNKRLGFTVGSGGHFIDSKLVFDFTARYFAFVLYFGGNFIVTKKTL